MGNEIGALALRFAPYANTARARNIFSEALDVGGVSASSLRLQQASTDLATAPITPKVKTVVSEVTTVSIRSMSAYTVRTESKDDAAKAVASGIVAGSSANAAGNVNVATLDTTNKGLNAGWVSVHTVLTYSDGSTDTSDASVGNLLKRTGDGLARKRLDRILGDSASASDLLAKLGITSATAAIDTVTGANNAAGSAAIQAHITTDFSVGLTYRQIGDQRSVTGVETGRENAIVAAFDPKNLTYDSKGFLSRTDESINFSANFAGGSLFENRSAPWLAGEITESSKAVTTFGGPNDIAVTERATTKTEFVSNPANSIQSSQTDAAIEIDFSQVVEHDGRIERERIALQQTETSGDKTTTSAGVSLKAQWQQTSNLDGSITWTPLPPPTTLLVAVGSRREVEARTLSVLS